MTRVSVLVDLSPAFDMITLDTATFRDSAFSTPREIRYSLIDHVHSSSFPNFLIELASSSPIFRQISFQYMHHWMCTYLWSCGGSGSAKNRRLSETQG